MRSLILAACLAALAGCSTPGATSSTPGPSNHGLTVTERNYPNEADARVQANHDCAGYARHAVLQNWDEARKIGIYVCE